MSSGKSSAKSSVKGSGKDTGAATGAKRSLAERFATVLVELFPGRSGKDVSTWLWLTILVVVLDQVTKFIIIQNFQEFDSTTIWPVLDVVRLHNEGAAFSMLANASGWQRWMFTGLGIGVSAFLLVWLLRLPARGHHRLAAALSLIMGGAVGNVIDRIRLGHVIDFIHVHYQDWYFPAFNVADSAITVGAGLLILDSLLSGSPKEE